MSITRDLRRGSRLATLFILGVCASGAWAEVVVYPKPSNLAKTDAAQQSSLYQVNVSQDGNVQSSFVYEIHADQKKDWRHNVASFTTFSFDGPVTVEVTKLSGDPIKSCRIYPTSYRIPASVVSPNKVSFKLDRPCKKMAIILNDDWVTHPLLVFGDVLEKDVPKADDPNVRFFAPGVYDLGQIGIKSNQTLYLAGGAYVKGYIDTKDLKSVSICGRGILSAEKRPDNGRGVNSKTVSIGGDSSKLFIEGITFIQSVGFACSLGGSHNTIRNIKVVGCWHPTTDGVNMGDDSLVEDCFFKCDDDSVKPYQSNVVIRRIVFWQMENGACIQLGWNHSGATRTNVHIYDCDIIRKDSDPKGGPQNRPNNAVISSVGGGATSRNYLIENIRAENINGRLFSLKTDTGEIADIVIRNFTATNWNNRNFHNEISTDKVHDIAFENLSINGQTIHSADEASFKTLTGARNIRFAVSKKGKDDE